MTSITESVAAMTSQWLLGRPASAHVPQWSQTLDHLNDEERERVLVAIASWCIDFTLRPQVPDFDQVNITELPQLDKPPMPENCREFFRNCLEPGQAGELLERVASYGFVAHPFDWFPRTPLVEARRWFGEDLPDSTTYDPWQEWADHTGIVSGGFQWWHEFRGKAKKEEVIKQRFDRRVLQLKEMRVADPDQARDLIAHDAAQATPDQQEQLIEVLGTNLSDSDRDYLTSCYEDHDFFARGTASKLLSRLGVSTASEQELADLRAAFRIQGNIVYAAESNWRFKRLLPESRRLKRLLKKRLRQPHSRTFFTDAYFSARYVPTSLADLSKALQVSSRDLVRARCSSWELRFDWTTMVNKTASTADIDEYFLSTMDAWGFLLDRATTDVVREVFRTKTLSDGYLGPWSQFPSGFARPEDIGFLDDDSPLPRISLRALGHVCTPEAASAILERLSPEQYSDSELAYLRLVASLGEAAAVDKESP
ncbi:MAG: DUF5691 domain-containing protein [Propionibacteriaceae bacterium]|nr:DUF5691 domain-containing protein [Propionibacteriaceae bacterium]